MSARSAIKRIGISIAAALAGTIAGVFTTGLLIAFHVASSAGARQADGAAGLGMIYASLYIPWVMLLVWFVVLLPLHLFLPASARVCRPGLASIIGGLAGVVAVEAILGLPSSHRVPIAFYILAAVVGAVTFYTGVSLIQSMSVPSAKTSNPPM